MIVLKCFGCGCTPVNHGPLHRPPQGTKMELPLWLSKGLYERKRRVLSVELPKVYREGWRTVFNADPNVVDLHKMGPYYYGLGSQMLHFDSPENPEIAQTLLQVSDTHQN